MIHIWKNLEVRYEKNKNEILLYILSKKIYNMQNCNICFDDYDESNLIKCIDTKCDAFICKNCFEAYIISSESIVKCVKQNCKYHYIKYNFIKFEFKPDIMTKYYKMCYDYFKGENKYEINNKYLNLVEKLREERNIFVKTFPSSIQKVINLCMKDKVNKINKTNKLFIDSILFEYANSDIFNFNNI